MVAAIVLTCAAAFLMLFGWGLSDWRGFFQEPIRAATLLAMFVVLATLSVLRLGLQPLRRGEAGGPLQTLSLVVMALASAWLVWLLPHNDRRDVLTLGAGAWLRWPGLALLLAGAVVRVSALRELGDHFSAYVTLQPDHRLVRSGIYAVVRHPLYSSLLLAAPGFALVFRSELVVPILFMTAAFVANRIVREEKLLTAHFGEQYASYKRLTWALLPFLL